MAGRSVVPVPLQSIQRRIPEAGRIRIGEKSTSGGKEKPTSLEVFRFTSADTDALEQIAAIYGGTPKRWTEAKAAKGQWQLKSTSSEIQVALPPGDPLGGTPLYEMWSGGGCERRCDGETCQTVTKGPDGPEFSDVPCLCMARGALACKVKVRLNVLLPEIRFTGTWRLETSSANAAEELPGMVEMIQDLHTKGLSRAVLRLTQRRSTVAGETHHYVVPTLGLPVSIREMMAGQGSVEALESPTEPARELAAGQDDPPPPPASHDDDDVVDAEVVPDDADLDLTTRALEAQGAAGMADAEQVWVALQSVHGEEEARRKLAGVVNGRAVLRMAPDGSWDTVRRQGAPA